MLESFLSITIGRTRITKAALIAVTRKLVLFPIVLLSVASTAYSDVVDDLGVLGNTYSIGENDLVDLIKERLAEREEAGDIDALNERMQERGKEYARRPPGVQLPRAAEYRAREIVPQYELPEDVHDAEGNVLFKAGTVVNPLEIRPLTKALCFFDGDDNDQIQWIKDNCTQNPRNKLILVSGDVQEVNDQLKPWVYFDQGGYLIERFDIQAVPAVIRQSEHVLYAEEFPVN